MTQCNYCKQQGWEACCNLTDEKCENRIERDCMNCEKTFFTTNENNFEFCHDCRENGF